MTQHAKPISIYKGGSSVILSNPRDIDLFYYYPTYESLVNFRQAKRDIEQDAHGVLIDNAKNLFVGAYVYPYMEHIEGIDLGLNDFEIKDFKKEYAEILLKYINVYRDYDLTNKHWYHIFLGYWALKNARGKKFTESQLNEAQEIHDNGISEKKLQVIFDYLTKIVNN